MGKMDVPEIQLKRFGSVIILIILMLSCASGFFLVQRSELHSAFYDVCDLVESKFYLKNSELEEWVSGCHKAARLVPMFVSRRELGWRIQDQMSLMHVSHFAIYTPAEDDKLWKGQATETGLRSRWMDGHMIVYQVLEDSPASKVGFQIGDEVLRVNGEDVESIDQVSAAAGDYDVLRGKAKLQFQLKPGVVKVDQAPRVADLGDGDALIEISSFRSEYFEATEWKKFAAGLKRFPHLIIDLRENMGGNFVAMLRAMSPLMCKPTLIGRLGQPRFSGTSTIDLPDDLSDDRQIEEVESNKSVNLKTYSDYGCFRGRLTVLIGPHTSSVAEIFAESIKARAKTRVWGLPSAGDVILAIWYDLPRMGPGYSVSIPQAVFTTAAGVMLEGRGVRPQKELFDVLSVWRSGSDSQLESARAVP
jgi:carboxyl-terminal processing protease